MKILNFNNEKLSFSIFPMQKDFPMPISIWAPQNYNFCNPNMHFQNYAKNPIGFVLKNTEKRVCLLQD
jgi:hypothetical protein